MTKAERSRNLRYKHPALTSLGYYFISDELYEIDSACEDIRWFMESDGETLLNALDGDEEDEWEFRMAFTDLDGKAENLRNMLDDIDIREYFDDCTVGLIGNRYKTVGYDDFEEDYFSLTSFEQELAYSEAGKKFMRRTKQEMISIIGQCWGIVISYLDIRQKYDYLKATFDILKDENTSILKNIADINEAYEAASKEGFYEYSKEFRRFETLVNDLPGRIWLEA